MNKTINNNSIPSFGAKLVLRSRNENCPFKNITMHQIEDKFEKQTGKSEEELLVVYDKDISFKDRYTFYYENKNHRDNFSISVDPEFSKTPLFVDKLKGILDLFRKREENINKIQKSITDFETDTVNELKKLTSASHISQYNKW